MTTENHNYHEARNIYESPRFCKHCLARICNQPILDKIYVGMVWNCTLTYKHSGEHSNMKQMEMGRG